MIFRQFPNEQIAALSYLIGCTATGEAAVVDPGLPAERYILAAADSGLRVTAILETHMHADYFSTGRALARLTGAPIYLPAAADARFPHRPLHDGERVEVGNITLRALHTPGHTPEHTAFVVSDNPRTYQPWFVLTGDCLFVGDVGRADLLDLPGSGPDLLYTSLFEKLMRLPDYVEVFPAHYGGSACGGKQMSGKASSTIGYERRFNWALQAPDLATFVEEVSANPRTAVADILLHRNTNRGQLPLPEGYGCPTTFPLPGSPPVTALSSAEAARAVAHGATVIDLRPQLAFAEAHPVDAINIAYNRTLLLDRLAGLLLPGEPVVFFADQPVIAHAAASLAASTGRNPVAGYVAGTLSDWTAEGLPTATLPILSLDDLHTRLADERTLVLDVRDPSEWAGGVIPGARLISLADLRDQLASLPRSAHIITICESGTRASAAASMLRRHGFPHVANVAPQGMSAYAHKYATVTS